MTLKRFEIHRLIKKTDLQRYMTDLKIWNAIEYAAFVVLHTYGEDTLKMKDEDFINLANILQRAAGTEGDEDLVQKIGDLMDMAYNAPEMEVWPDDAFPKKPKRGAGTVEDMYFRNDINLDKTVTILNEKGDVICRDYGRTALGDFDDMKIKEYYEDDEIVTVIVKGAHV